MVGSDQGDRELLMVATSLERLAVRVQARFDPDMDEAADDNAPGAELADCARLCLAILDDPRVSARLEAASVHRW
jgi:hypothetical protein